jgi:(p)ppGpp synthase/HD superfamily hydrolase
MNLNQYARGKELIDKAKQFATTIHAGQNRIFSKNPYITHPSGVVDLINNFRGTPEMISAAWLHDVVEDCGVTLDDLKELFGNKVADLVKELTNQSDLDKDKKHEYLLDKMGKMSSEALTIKLADRLHNVSDLINATSSFARKYASETTFIVNGLQEIRPLTHHQTTMVDEIRKAIKPYEED